MAENDTHYNDSSFGRDYGLTPPLPDFGEGGPVFPGDNGTPVIPLPNPGEGGPVFPGDGGTPVIPLPNPGEGGPVYPGNGGTPVIPLPNPGEGGPVFPGCTTCPPITPGYFGQVRFLNASTNSFPVNIMIDSSTYALNSTFGTITNYERISDGFHTVTVRRATGMRSILLQQTFPFVSGQKVTMVLTDTAAGGLEMIRVVDTGCSNLPRNTGCYRFANMSYSGSRVDVTLYGGDTVFRNVGFQNVTSYKQAVAGNYQLYATPSNSFAITNELPIIVLGAIGNGGGAVDPLVVYDVIIEPGRNYTTYLIGNTWSEAHMMRVLTVQD